MIYGIEAHDEGGDGRDEPFIGGQPNSISGVRIEDLARWNGASEYLSSADPSIFVRGLVPPTGGARHYPVWRRNAANFCTSSTFNFMNRFSVAWSA